MFIIRCKNRYGTTYLERWQHSDKSIWAESKRNAKRYETLAAAETDMHWATTDLSGPAKLAYSIVED